MTAVNGVGYQVEALTKEGWKRASKIVATMAEAELMLPEWIASVPDMEFRAYEALSEAKAK
jgi:hypothetical protein